MKILEKKRCGSCFREYEGGPCPYCGGAQNEEHQLPVGTVIRDRYQIGKVLGQGGFGITYIAWDTLMQKSVAVKEFYPTGTVFRKSELSTAVECGTKAMVPHYEYSRERFLREASALVQFQEIPEVVGIQDFVKENNTAYIVMEYVRGVDLAKYIQRKGGRLSVDETFRILTPVMEALAKVHKGGIVHRDISPDNIILDPMGGAKLLDFGAVRAVEDPDVDKGLSKSTEAILKQGFAPIEQYNTRGSLGPWTDEYAMCATIFYCLTGRIPEDASIRMSEGIDPDWSSIPGLPEHQQKALEKGISCRAKDRYPNMDQLLEALFPEEKAQTVPEPAEEAPVTQVKEKTKAPQRSGQKFWIVFTAAILVLWVVLAVFLPKEAQTEAGETVPQDTIPQETVPVQIQTQPTEPLETEPPTVALSPEEEAYLQAEALLEEGKLGEAAIAFGKLAGFSDARERSFAIWDKIAARDTISAGWVHSLGLKTDGTVVAAGSNYVGDYIVEDWTDIVAISAGGQHTVGLRTDGFVVAVGLNDSGQCDISGWADIVAVSAGNFHTVGLCVDGTVVAMGSNGQGQCDVSSWSDIIAVSAGNSHTVGLRADGTVVAVGANDYGQCDVEEWSNIVAIAAGGWHTVGLKADSTVVAVGYNQNGECDAEEWSNIVAIAAGGWHTVGLKDDGAVIAVGLNIHHGQCNVMGWSDIVAISAGKHHSLGLQANGTVVAVGSNEYGQCGMALWAPWTDIMLPQKPVPFR